MLRMKNPVWTNAIKRCAEPERARHIMDLLATTSGKAVLENCSAEQARVLAALFSGSQALGNLLVARPDWLTLLNTEALKFPRRKQGLFKRGEPVAEAARGRGDYVAALSGVRDFKQREMLAHRSPRSRPVWRGSGDHARDF